MPVDKMLKTMSVEDLTSAGHGLVKAVEAAEGAGRLIVELMGDLTHELLIRAVGGDEDVANMIARNRDLRDAN